MPKLGSKKTPQLTASQEKFAREYVRLGSAAAAYRLAYNTSKTTKPETIWSSASETLAIPHVRQRVEELTKKAAERAVVSRASMISEMEQNRQFAFLHENPAAVNSASRDKAKVAGILKDQVELTGKDGAALQVETEVSVEARTANDIARRVAWLLRKGQKAKASQAE